MDDLNYFARCTDELFWGDKERVNLLITLYEKHECLWDVASLTYKNILKKKQAKVDIGKHFGMSGMCYPW
jgi:Alcohol dehydrogenase transcription factor Myb/SANT-like